jgi:two-component system, chemotaxis family, sensor kinase CheA
MEKIRPTDFGIEPEVLLEFIDESQEQLDKSINICIENEGKALDAKDIDEIFRTVHTIKGNSAFLNLMKIKNLAHSLENLMNLIRMGNAHFKGEVADTVITGIEMIQEMLGSVKAGKPETNDPDGLQKIIGELNQLVERAKETDLNTIWQNVQETLMKLAGVNLSDEGQNHIKELQWQLDLLSPVSGAVASDDKDNDLFSKIKKILQSQDDPNEEFDPETTSQVELLLNELVANATADTKSIAEDVLDIFNTMVPVMGLTPVVGDIMLEKAEGVHLRKSEPKATKADEAIQEDHHQESAEAEGKKSDDSGGDKSNKTLRVREDDIDQFLDYVGDLIIINEMYEMLDSRLKDENISSKTTLDLRNNNKALETLSYNLQKAVLNVRKVPVGQLFQRAPRMLRNIAKNLGKEVKTEIIGDDLEIDKSYLETLDGPFTHLLRNAIDHGIEKPEERIAAGKTSYGNVRIYAEENKDEIVIAIEDDGKGIDAQKIIGKARERGIISKDQVLTDSEAFQLIFHAGISTAKEVTDVSGRGVGMDVVQHNISELGGRIHIMSSPGEGTTFLLNLPRSVAVKIIQGMLVSVAGERYILPMDMIGMSLEVLPKDVSKIQGNRGECLVFQDEVLPIVRINEILDLKDSRKKKQIGISSVIAGKKFLFLVDNLIDTVRVVVKDIVGLGQLPREILGGAIMGDERVVLILDLEKIVSREI